jgi:hypoxanthine phosphoribosyltransferase
MSHRAQRPYVALSSKPSSDYCRRQRVRSLTESDLDHECERLYQRISDAGVRPTHVIGIATAGNHVARSLVKWLHRGVPLLEIGARRSSTGVKERIGLRHWLARLPDSYTSELRRLENRLITRRLNPDRRVSMRGEQISLLMTLDGTRASVLVVDDCVDTGASLKAVLAFVRDRVGPDTAVYSAALTSTIEHPLVQPDFKLYENTQFRGPWSHDS